MVSPVSVCQKVSYSVCEFVSQSVSWYYTRPKREIENNACAQFLGANKVHHAYELRG